MPIENDVERMAAAINAMSEGINRSLSVMDEAAICVLLAHFSGFSQNSAKQMLRAIQQLPEKALTAHGRSIRIRD